MLLWLKGKTGLLANDARHCIVVFVFTDRRRGVRQVRSSEEEFFQFFVGLDDFSVEGLYPGRDVLHLRDYHLCVLAFFFKASDLFRDLVFSLLKGLRLFYERPSLFVQRPERRKVRAFAARSETRLCLIE